MRSVTLQISERQVVAAMEVVATTRVGAGVSVVFNDSDLTTLSCASG